MTYDSPVPDVPGEGRWVLMTETIFERCLELLRSEDPLSTYTVRWGEPEHRPVTFYTPTITRHEVPTE